MYIYSTSLLESHNPHIYSRSCEHQQELRHSEYDIVGMPFFQLTPNGNLNCTMNSRQVDTSSK